VQNLYWLCILIIFFGCQTNEKQNIVGKDIIKTDTVKHSVTQKTNQSDSTLLLHHLDSLPSIQFPYHSVFYNLDFPEIDLSEFSNKKLTQLPFKKIPRVIGGGSFDQEEEDSTFNLINEAKKAEWNLIAKHNNFFLVEARDNGVFLVTLTYNLQPIDAIRIAMADKAGNRHWNANRHSYISKDLTITLRHFYAQVGGIEDHYTVEGIEQSKENWMIDLTGHFKKINSR
jgi:hypothetical protein